MLFTASERLSCSAFPALREHAKFSLLFRNIALGWLRRRKEDAEEGTPIFPLVSSSFLPILDLLVLSFPGGTWAVNSQSPPKVSPQQKASQERLGCFCFVPPGQTSREAELYFYLTRALWREKWTFALLVCDTGLLNVFLSRVHVPQCETLAANQKALDKYTCIKGSMLVVQTIYQ